ncbi:hypothetical protein ABZP36_028955 [Zizania latifolia]
MGSEVLRPHAYLERFRTHAHAAKRSPRRQAARPGARRSAARGAQAAPSVTRQIRVKAAADAYAGPAFGAMSPSPRALPLPRFSSSRAGSPAAGVDHSATRELRRLLGLH